MTKNEGSAVNILIMAPMGGQPLVDQIEAVAPGRLNVYDVWGDVVPELNVEVGEDVVRRFAGGRTDAARHSDEFEELLRTAHVVILGFPILKTIPERMPALRWAHFGGAGVSGLIGSPWWGSDSYVMTSSRGHANALPIAESVMAGTYMFARRIDEGVRTTLRQEFERAPFASAKLITGKTMAIVGLGGIGGHLARIAKGCGMRVIATRRSATERRKNSDGIDEIFPPSQLNDMLAEADYVAVTAAQTPETTNLMDKAAFDAVKPGAFLINVARGEIIDDAALVEALKSGRLAGAYLDVWRDDFAGPPNDLLRSAPNIVFTPHISLLQDAPPSSPAFFCANLQRFLDGEPLENVVDWERGY